jgi:hypothetical protein
MNNQADAKKELETILIKGDALEIVAWVRKYDKSVGREKLLVMLRESVLNGRKKYHVVVYYQDETTYTSRKTFDYDTAQHKANVLWGKDLLDKNRIVAIRLVEVK